MEMVVGFLSFVSWGYTLIGAVGAYGLGIRLAELPDWWRVSAVVAVITLAICIAGCVHDAKKPSGKDARRLGVIRYDPEADEWYCAPDTEDRQ